IPIGGVPTGQRNIEWHPNKPETLVWVEALDDGNPKKKVPARDKVMWITMPDQKEPVELAQTEKRFAGIEFGERGDLAILRDFDRDTLRSRAWFFNPEPTPEKPGSFHADKGSEKTLVWDMSSQDRYHDPGQPMLWPMPNGHQAVMMQENCIFLVGEGASPEGARPFLDRFDITTLRPTRLFQGEVGAYEEIIAMLSTSGGILLTRRESPTDPPNYLIHKPINDNGYFAAWGPGTSIIKFTAWGDAAPQLRAIKKELVKYKR